jgi:hypothetical protein
MRARPFLFLGALVITCIAASCSCSDEGNTGTTSNDASFPSGGGGQASTSKGGDNGVGGRGGSTGTFNIGGSNGGGSTGCLITCDDVGADCGPISNGCGDIVQCGDCTPPDFCGGGGPNKCGGNTCTPQTCGGAGATCGPIGDGCGNVLDCGTCSLPETCGGSGTPSSCGINPNCTNLCLQQVTCPTSGVTTTISGIVYAPNGVDPLPNAVVYVPNAPVDAFTQGVTCDQCGADASGSPLVSDVTDNFGAFTIENVPVGSNIPLVIQIGRWRRQITVPTVTACQDNPISAGTARLPRNKSEGDIPRIAFATGDVDVLECIMRKIGVEDGEFGNPTGNGRIHLYTGTGNAGARYDASTPGENTLWGSLSTLLGYDMVLFPCQAAEYRARLTPQGLQNVIDYANQGGRIFATHYSYVWLEGNGAFDGVAAWAPEGTNPVPDPQVGFIDMTFPKGQSMAEWLFNIGASTTLGEMQIGTLRWDFTSVVAPTQLWVSVNQPGPRPMHMTFNTPVGSPPDQQCGRVVFSDIHVMNHASIPTNTNFPNECSTGPMTPQERMLMFMIFDLGSCITPDIPTCTAVTCEDQSIECGPAGDGCGGLLDCGPCPPGETCGGGGQPGVCGNQGCNPLSCEDQNIECGPAGDGCGGLIQSCGTCQPPQTCGGGGEPGQCGGGIPG